MLAPLLVLRAGFEVPMPVFQCTSCGWEIHNLDWDGFPVCLECRWFDERPHIPKDIRRRIQDGSTDPAPRHTSDGTRGQREDEQPSDPSEARDRGLRYSDRTDWGRFLIRLVGAREDLNRLIALCYSAYGFTGLGSAEGHGGPDQRDELQGPQRTEERNREGASEAVPQTAKQPGKLP